MKCLETRTGPDGLKRRRYETTSGDRFTTVEVPMSVWKYINRQGRGNNRAAAFQRVLDRNSQKQQAVNLLRAGKTKSEVAKLLRRDRGTVARWAAEKSGSRDVGK